MPNTESLRIPTYRKHKPSGQAVVTLNGKDHYLGAHRTAASKETYNRLVQEWLVRGRRLPESNAELIVNKVILAYWRVIEPSITASVAGSTPGELYNQRSALRIVRELYGRTPAAEFGPLALKAVRQKMIETGWCRAFVNRQVNRVRRMFRWAVSEELIPAHVYHGLQSVEGLRRGKSGAREKAPVRPVPEAFVDAVLPYLLPPVRAMVELQRLTGMRPGEVLSMRGCDLDTTGAVWIYAPQSHKTQHLGHRRAIYIGPKAQLILKPFLKSELAAYLFSPKEAEVFRNAERRKQRRTPLTPSQRKRKPKAKRRRAPGLVYDIASYRRAIARACNQAEVPHWHPHQLRHNAATRLRKEFGLERARAVLGHRSPVVTEIYAELDGTLAASVMEKIG
jgi:integrase